MNEATQLRIDVTIQQQPGGFGSLRFSEEMEIAPANFQALAAILARFHELFLELKRQNAKLKP